MSGGASTEFFSDVAIDFMQRHQDRPFFVYLAYNAPHFTSAHNRPEGQLESWQAPPEFFEVYGRDPDTKDEKERYQAVVTALDHHLGRFLTSLDHLGLTDNTLLMFYSDNGAFMLPAPAWRWPPTLRCATAESRSGKVGSASPLGSGGLASSRPAVSVPSL